MTPKVKICGITRVEDALVAAELGADYLGFVFVKESPRYVTPEQARVIAVECVRASPHSRMVGVFRDEDPETVRKIAEHVGLDLVQLHGEETYTLGGIPTIKAFQVSDALPEPTTAADYVLFDSGGGTGRTFDWSLLDGYVHAKPFFLAGGLTPENVLAAITSARPYAIDLSSGVESRPGLKDGDKMRLLFEALRR